MARSSRILIVGSAIVIGAFLTACAAGDPRFTAEAPAGFWVGLWHGMISLVTLAVGIFAEGVEVYERHNTGGWYDFGFLFGALAIWGSGSKVHPRMRRRRRSEQEWEQIAEKVQEKVRRMIREWAEAEPQEDWSVVEAKAEAKLKRKVRQWADEP